MKNIIIGILIGILINGLFVFAAEKIVANPLQQISVPGASFGNNVSTCQVTVSEGTYRLFIYMAGNRGGITAVRIK